MIIGITGGVGSGKSEVLNILKEDYKADIIIADQVAHELMEPGAVSYNGIVEYFGKTILKEDKTIDRGILGEIVFQNPEKLQKLNQITHKNVDKEILNRIEDIQKKNPEGFIVCEAALLVGAEYESLFQQLWYIFTRENIRFERLKKSRGYSDEKIRQMISSQKSEEEFKRQATHLIDNSGKIEDTRRQIMEILGEPMGFKCLLTHLMYEK